MKKIYPFLILFSLVSFECNSQTVDKLITDIADFSCECMNKLDSSDTSKNELSSCIGQSYVNYQLRLSEEMITYMNKNNVTESEAGTYFQKQIVKYLFNDCPIFYSFSVNEAEKQTNLITAKLNNEIVNKSATEICECIDKIASLTQLEIDICLDASTNTSNKEFQKEYKKDPKIAQDLSALLMSNCTKYSKFAVNKKFN
jgi:hypothetical protein